MQKYTDMTVWQLPWSTDKGAVNEIKQYIVLLASINIVLHVERLHCSLGPMDVFWTHPDSVDSNTEQIMTSWYSYLPEKLLRNSRANEGGMWNKD